MKTLRITLAQRILFLMAPAKKRRIGSPVLSSVYPPTKNRQIRISRNTVSGRWLLVSLFMVAFTLLSTLQPVAASSFLPHHSVEPGNSMLVTQKLDSALLQDEEPMATRLALYLPLIDGGKRNASMAAGSSHTCALADGSLKCWGANQSGQLGDGTTTERATPTAVSGLSGGVTAITAGFDYSCAIVNGAAKCWGTNQYGALGDGTNIDRQTPTTVSGLNSKMSAIAAGYFHACAATNNGAVKCWGNNTDGRLGNDATADSTTPVAVSGLSSGVTALVAGWGHTCALTKSGGVKCWGNNESGQLGDGTTTSRSTPANVSGLTSGVIALAAADSHTCALTKGGSVLCWGNNSYGQLGNDQLSNSSTPVAVNGLNSGVTAMTASYGHTCVLLGTATVQCWGYNNTGQLGDGTVNPSGVPIEVSGTGSGIIALAAGWGHTCVMSNGGAKCWGNNMNGQLGDATTTYRPSPVDVAW